MEMRGGESCVLSHALSAPLSFRARAARNATNATCIAMATATSASPTFWPRFSPSHHDRDSARSVVSGGGAARGGPCAPSLWCPFVLSGGGLAAGVVVDVAFGRGGGELITGAGAGAADGVKVLAVAASETRNEERSRARAAATARRTALLRGAMGEEEEAFARLGLGRRFVAGRGRSYERVVRGAAGLVAVAVWGTRRAGQANEWLAVSRFLPVLMLILSSSSATRETECLGLLCCFFQHTPDTRNYHGIDACDLLKTLHYFGVSALFFY